MRCILFTFFQAVTSSIYIFWFPFFTYNRLSNEKTPYYYDDKKEHPLFGLKLTDKLDKYVLLKLKIDPYLTFKKDGEKVTYDDHFYFENPLHGTHICYKRIPKL